MKEAAEARASQEDPIVMYLIVHESLGMSIGKTAAQCAHASSMLMIEYFEVKDASRIQQKMLQQTLPEPEKATILAEYKTSAPKLSIYGEWMKSSFRKVVLRASDKEWEKLKEELKDSILIVRDAGLTEVAAGSETVIGVWPMRKSQRPKTITRLQVLK
jgi:peptidyl-tRNA hydrolase, PTH2 family